MHAALRNVGAVAGWLWLWMLFLQANAGKSARHFRLLRHGARDWVVTRANVPVFSFLYRGTPTKLIMVN